MQDKLQQEDTVSADRKIRIIIDPKTGKRRQTSSVVSRQNFDSEKFGNRNKQDDDDIDNVKESTIQPTGTSQIDVGATERAVDAAKDSKKSSGQIQFVTGNQRVTSSTAIGNAQNMGIKKISESIVKKAMAQVKVDKNVGTEEIPVDGSCGKPACEMDSNSNSSNVPNSRARQMARQAMKHVREELKGDQHKLDKNKNGKLDKHDFKLLRKEEQGLAEGLPQTLRKVVPGYAKREIDKKMDAGKFGKTDADKDANFQRYKKIQDKIKEQAVAEEKKQLTELSRDTLLSYSNKVSLDSQKHSKDPTKRSGEKASRSVAGYAKANNRLEKPVKEESELKEKNGLWDNIHAKQKRIKAGSGEKMRKPGSEGAPTDAALKASQNKLNKEETTMSKTYADFVQQLQEYNASKDGVYRHKGTYGGSYDSSDDEDDDKPKAKPADAPKRGRGRPAGSKSGANQKVTTGKSYGGIATHTLSLPNSK
jgi:hypothetical protein